MKFLKIIFITFILISCQNSKTNISSDEFNKLMKNVAKGWSNQNTDLALSSFTENAIYMEPPNIQFYQGHEQLRPYFDELDATYKMKFHNLWFNKESQSGAGEYTLSYGKDSSDVGIVVVELEKGKIKFWREYQRKGPTDFRKFLEIENKEWQWHIGNYPAPKDSITQK